MASATMHLINDIYAPSQLADFYIDPSKITWTNGRSNVGDLAPAWQVRSGSIDCYAGSGSFTYSHVYYTHVGPWNPENDEPGWIPEPLPTLTFIFDDAAVKLSNGVRYNLKVDLVTTWAFNIDDYGRDIAIVALSDDTDAISADCLGFWVQSYVIGTGGANHSSVSTTVRLSIVNDSGTTQSGTFYYPFVDIDSTYDSAFGYKDKVKDPGYHPGGDYAESAEILSNCTHIYAKSGQFVPESGVFDGSWLKLWQGHLSTSTFVRDTNGHSYSYNSGVAGQGLWFYNSLTRFDNPGVHTGIIGLFTSGAQIQWRGSDCGTSLRGEGMLTTLKYDGNAPAGATTSNVPGNQYKAKGHSLTLSSQVPTCTAGSARYTFKGWSKTRSGSVAYQPGGTFTEDNVDGSITLYAIWEPAYLITLHLQGGYAWINNKWDSTTPIGDWVPSGSSYIPSYTLQRLGYTFGGWATSSSSTTPVTFPVTVDGPKTYYAIWTKKSFQVRFHDGYTSGNDVIKTVTVSYGGSVPSTEVPVPGQTYSGRVFKKPGMYSFEGWAGSWTNVTSDRDVIALWEFTPIWVKKNNKWVKYKPVEP